MRRVFAIVKKEIRQIRRQKQVLMILFVVPIIQLIVFGYVITTDIKNIDVGIFDFDNSSFSRQLAEKIKRSGYFRIHYFRKEFTQREKLLRSRKVDALLVIPSDFKRRVLRREKAEVLLVLNAMDSNTASITAGYITRIFKDFSLKIAAQGNQTPGIEMTYSAWFNPELKSVYYMVPGIVGIILTIVCTLLIGFSIVREKQTGTLEQISITPVRPYEFFLGKMIPYAIAGFLSMSLSLLVGQLWFSVPMRGSYPLLLFASLLYVFTALGIGVLISTFSTTLLQVLFFTWFTLLFELLLSGVLIPIRNMPDFIQLLTNINPLKFYTEILRTVFLKGAGIDVIGTDMLILLVFAIISFGISGLIFRRRTFTGIS